MRTQSITYTDRICGRNKGRTAGTELTLICLHFRREGKCCSFGFGQISW